MTTRQALLTLTRCDSLNNPTTVRLKASHKIFLEAVLQHVLIQTEIS